MGPAVAFSRYRTELLFHSALVRSSCAQSWPSLARSAMTTMIVTPALVIGTLSLFDPASRDATPPHQYTIHVYPHFSLQDSPSRNGQSVAWIHDHTAI